VAPPPAALTARELGIELMQPGNVNDESVARSVAEAGETRVLCAFGALITTPLLDGPPIYNVHPSLLPRWRGAAPIERAIQAGDRETGVSIMRLVAELDAGPVYAQRSTPITDDDDYASLSTRLLAISNDLLTEVLDARPDPTPQPSEGVAYAEKIDATDRTVSLGDDPAAVVRTVRALRPHIGARLELPDGTFLGVEDAAVGGDGRVQLRAVKPAGGRSMAYEDYERGHGPVEYTS
jgi:methionyl-tRNA formyltransferase